LGGYGFIRVLIIIFSKSTVFFLPITDSFAVISIIYAALTTIRQIDLKRIVAYSSISHMNLVVLGIFSGNIQGVMGGIFLMLAHGVVSSALFFLIGVLYDRYATRLIYYYGGLVQTMPIFSAQLIIFCFANIGVPGSCNFIGEVVIFVGLVDRNLFILIVAVSGVILSVIYTMIFCNKLVFGNLNINFIFIYSDMSFREICIISPLFFFTIFFGIFPDVIFDCLITSVSTSIEYYNI
jgi:NADH:ubiquinone oxidoreductase subunit 4 (subunit M)